jgi:hypothetical protein
MKGIEQEREGGKYFRKGNSTYEGTSLRCNIKKSIVVGTW